MEKSKEENQGKKAQSHVEIILSFVIFIGFLLFIFVIINPFAKTKETGYRIENIQNAIIGDISSSVGKMSIILSEAGTCYNFNETEYDNYLEIQENNRKISIYFNEIFENYQTKKQENCGRGNYTLGVYSEEDLVIIQKIQDLKADYEESYENLKKSLSITSDFSFSVEEIGGSEIPELSVYKAAPGAVDVEAREIPFRAIDSEDKAIRNLLLKIRAW